MAVNMDTLLRLRVAVDGENNIRRLSGELKGLERAAGSVSSGFNAMRAASAALASSAVVAGLTGIIKNAIDAGDELNNLQMKTGIAADALLGLRAAAKLGDVDTAMLAKGLNRLNVVIAEAAAGNQQSADKFKGLGVSIRDASGQVASTDVVFKRLADRFRDMPDGAGKAAAAAALFGTKMGAEFIPVLNEGSMAMDNLNVKIGDDFPARSDQFNDTLTVMGLKTQAMGLELTEALLPALQSIFNEFSNLFDTKEDWSLLFETIKIGVRSLATFVFASIKLVDQLIKSVQTLAGAFGAITAGDFGLAFNILKEGWTGQMQQAMSDFAAIGRMFTDAPVPPSSRRRGGREADTATMRGIEDQAPGGGRRGGSGTQPKSLGAEIALALKESLSLSPAQAAGIVGNFMRESGLNPRVNEGGAVGMPRGVGGYGLAQWTGTRQTDLVRFAGGAANAGSLDAQLRFTISELLGPEKRALEMLRTATTPEDAAVLFDKFYERSGIKALGERKANARQVFGEIAGTGAGSGLSDYARAEEERQKAREAARQQLEDSKVLLAQSEMDLNIQKATTDEQRIQLEYQKEATQVYEKYVDLGAKAKTSMEWQNINQAYNNEMKALELDYENQITEARQKSYEATLLQIEAQREAMTQMGDALGGQVFGTPDIVAPGDQQFSPFAGYVEGIGSMNEALNGLATTGFKGIEDAMVSLATTGKANFREFAAALLEDTARLIIQQLVLKTILSAIGGPHIRLLLSRLYDHCQMALY